MPCDVCKAASMTRPAAAPTYPRQTGSLGFSTDRRTSRKTSVSQHSMRAPGIRCEVLPHPLFLRRSALDRQCATPTGSAMHRHTAVLFNDCLAACFCASTWRDADATLCHRRSPRPATGSARATGRRCTPTSSTRGRWTRRLCRATTTPPAATCAASACREAGEPTHSGAGPDVKVAPRLPADYATAQSADGGDIVRGSYSLWLSYQYTASTRARAVTQRLTSSLMGRAPICTSTEIELSITTGR